MAQTAGLITAIVQKTQQSASIKEACGSLPNRAETRLSFMARIEIKGLGGRYLKPSTSRAGQAVWSSQRLLEQATAMVSARKHDTPLYC